MKEEKELTYGETIKQPFPNLEDIEEFTGPSWLFPIISDAKPSHLSSKWTYKAYKLAYENGVDVTWKLKQTDPHAEIKAEHEKAKEKYDVVKVFCSHKESSLGWSKIDFKNMCDYRDDEFKFELRYYSIDWNKLLSWSYANEFIPCQFSHNSGFNEIESIYTLRGMEMDDFFIDADGALFKYCRLAKGVEIKDEWLKEIK